MTDNYVDFFKYMSESQKSAFKALYFWVLKTPAADISDEYTFTPSYKEHINISRSVLDIFENGDKKTDIWSKTVEAYPFLYAAHLTWKQFKIMMPGRLLDAIREQLIDYNYDIKRFGVHETEHHKKASKC